MTLEECFHRIAINSGRIADALEAIAASQGIVPEAPGEEEPAKKPATKKKVTKKKASKKKASKKTVGKKEEPAETDLTIKDDVRPVLKKLREEVSHAAVKGLLKKYGASTLQQLEARNYQNIIDDALEQLGDSDGQDELDLEDDDL